MSTGYVYLVGYHDTNAQVVSSAQVVTPEPVTTDDHLARLNEIISDLITARDGHFGWGPRVIILAVSLLRTEPVPEGEEPPSWPKRWAEMGA